tara:strand:- start:344 stop:1393 length:1050 start_codon:yes stop_codon:yes gene_type:complete
MSDYPYESLIGYNGPIFFFRYLFFILGIKFLLSTNPRLLNIFCLSLIATLSFTIIDGYLQWITGSNILGFTPTNTRISGIFNDEQILGHFLSHIVPLAMGLLVYLYGSSKKQIILIIIFLVLSEILIFITNDRSGFLKIFQFSLLIIFLSNNFKLFRLISFGITLAIITFILNTSNSSKERYSGTVSEISSTSVPYMPMTIHHESHYKIAFNMFKEKPIIGKGPQSFRILCDRNIEYQQKKGCTNHPHNYYFQTLAELGLIGLGLLTSIFFYLSYILLKQFIYLWIKKNHKSSLLPDHLVILFSLILVLFWPIIPHQSFYNNWLNVIIFLPIGFLLFFLKQNDKLPKQK